MKLLPVNKILDSATNKPIPIWHMFDDRIFVLTDYNYIKGLDRVLSLRDEEFSRVKPDLIVPSFAAFNKWNLGGAGIYSQMHTDLGDEEFNQRTVERLLTELVSLTSKRSGISSIGDLSKSNQFDARKILQKAMAHQIVFMFEMYHNGSYPEIRSNQPLFMLSRTYPLRMYEDMENEWTVHRPGFVQNSINLSGYGRPLTFDEINTSSDFGTFYDMTYPIQIISEFIMFIRDGHRKIAPNSVKASHLMSFIENAGSVRRLETIIDTSYLKGCVANLIQKNSFGFDNDIEENCNVKPKEFRAYDI